MTLLGFALVYGASERRLLLGRAARSETGRRVLRLGGLLILTVSAALWCRELGIAGGLICWLAAASAAGSAIILAAPVAPRAVLVGMVSALVGGLL
jgi:hypothetical protein